jgi:hypothetical protein
MDFNQGRLLGFPFLQDGGLVGDSRLGDELHILGLRIGFEEPGVLQMVTIHP